MVTTVAVYFAIGRLLIWAISVAKPTERLWRLFGQCDFCVGTWVYFALAVTLSEPTRYQAFAPIMYVPVITELILAVLFSLTATLLRQGWEAKFGTINYS